MKIILKGQNEIRGIAPSPVEAAKWWQWILSIARPYNPLESGNTSQNQGLPFLCLACTGGGEDMNRIFSISGADAKKDILVPVFTSAYSNAELGSGTTDYELLAKARDDVKNPKQLELNIDDLDLRNLQEHYVECGPFKVNLPPDHILDEKIPPGTYRAMSAGYWLKISHLPGGSTHMIKFGGTGRNGFHTRVGYVMNTPNQEMVVSTVRQA
jgi:hypothetical protein